MSATAIVWLRRDLRVSDNPALAHAIRHADRVIPLYIHAPEEEAPWQPGAASRWWLHHSLKALDASLRELGSGLVIRGGNSQMALREVARETGAERVCWSRLYDPIIRDRDASAQSALRHDGIMARIHRGALLREPEEALKKDGAPYRVFTPFSHRYLHEELPDGLEPRPDALPRLPSNLASLTVDELELLPSVPWYRHFKDHWTPGEAGALAALGNFVDHAGVFEYEQARNLPGHDGVSGLSPHLHFGEISARQVWRAVRHATEGYRGDSQSAASRNARSFLRQLVWRDFAHHILRFHPRTPTEPFNPRYRAFRWDVNPELTAAWRAGRTGIPLVDAGMRQLWQTGWMHNRTRMVVATVLSKHGLVHWLEGARWFWDTLVDADLANNTLGWQWTAGCGVDAAPYFRVLNPVRQGERFDPKGDYVRRWVPELAALPDRHIHAPWSAPSAALQKFGVTLGVDYPRPLVHPAEGRARALARYKELD